MTWYIYQCPNCKFCYRFSFNDKPKILRCPTCLRYYSIKQLEMMYDFIGYFKEATKEQSERWEKRAVIDGLRDEADRLEGNRVNTFKVEVIY